MIGFADQSGYDLRSIKDMIGFADQSYLAQAIAIARGFQPR